MNKIQNAKKNGSSKQFIKIKKKSLSVKKVKIKLTDLCIEEKLKVGELITTLQNKNEQIVKLKEQIESLKKDNLDLKQQLNQYTKINQSYIQQLSNSNKLYAELHNINLNYESKIRDISINYSNQIKNKQFNKITYDQYTNTQQKNMLAQGVQTKKKKKNFKDVYSQTNFQFKISSVYPYHKLSKSFQKIMGKNNQLLQIQQIKVNSFDKQHQIQQRNSQNLPQKNSQEQFQQITKKWFQLKDNSFQNLQKIQKKHSENKYFINQSPQFLNNEQQDEVMKTQDNYQIDDIQLNKIIKSNNFSASRLMKQKLRNSSFNKSKYNQSESKLGSSNSKPIDFYETHLLELVQQNPKKFELIANKQEQY